MRQLHYCIYSQCMEMSDASVRADMHCSRFTKHADLYKHISLVSASTCCLPWSVTMRFAASVRTTTITLVLSTLPRSPCWPIGLLYQQIHSFCHFTGARDSSMSFTWCLFMDVCLVIAVKTTTARTSMDISTVDMLLMLLLLLLMMMMMMTTMMRRVVVSSTEYWIHV